jgi:hypothetical protein
MLFAIDQYEVLDIQPMPDLPKQRLELVERPGVDGTAIWETGVRGRPCTVRTRVDQPDPSTAMEVFGDYCSLVDEDPVEVTFAARPMSDLGAKYQVLDVRIIEICGITGASGGLNSPSEAWLECEWDLLPVPCSDGED